MHLQDVDVLEPEARERLVDRVKDVLARQAVAVDVAALVRVADLGRVRVRVVGDDHAELGHDDEVLARDGELCDGLPDEALRVSVRVDVGLRTTGGGWEGQLEASSVCGALGGGG